MSLYSNILLFAFLLIYILYFCICQTTQPEANEEKSEIILSLTSKSKNPPYLNIMYPDGFSKKITPSTFPSTLFKLGKLSPGNYNIDIFCEENFYPTMKLEIGKKDGLARLSRNDEVYKVYPSQKYNKDEKKSNKVKKDLNVQNNQKIDNNQNNIVDNNQNNIVENNQKPQQELNSTSIIKFIIASDSKRQYFLNNKEIKIIDWLKNPIVIIIIVSIVSLYFASSMAENPQMKEMQDYLGGGLESFVEKMKDSQEKK